MFGFKAQQRNRQNLPGERDTSLKNSSHLSDSFIAKSQDKSMKIQAIYLNKTYGNRPVLKGVSLEIQEGEFWTLLGRNGSGKSTLMRILMRQIPVDQGELVFTGLKHPSEHLNQVFCVLEKENEAHDWDLGAYYQKLSEFYPHWSQVEFDRITLLYGVPLDRKPDQLSRGQKTQVQIAAALASGAKLILLDEVTAVLDARARAHSLRELRAFCDRGGSVLLATNIATEVQGFATHVFVLENGSIVLNHSVQKLQEIYFKTLCDESKMSSLLTAKTSWVPVGQNSNKTFSLVNKRSNLSGAGFKELDPDRRGITIEDVFLYHTSSEPEIQAFQKKGAA